MSRPVPRSLLLLCAMTLFTLAGPLGFGLVLRGGRSPAWPPDRAVEWWALGLTSAAMVGLMAGTIAAGLAERGRR